MSASLEKKPAAGIAKEADMASLLFVLFVLVAAHALLGCGGCSGREQAPVVAASAESAASPANAPTPEAAVPPADILWKLTPNARSVYYFLLLDLAMRRDEEAKAVQALRELTLLPDIDPRLFLEGVVWLLARKSRYSFDVIDKALAAYPDDISLHLLNAEALLEYGRAEKALDHMREFSAQHPEVTEAKTEFALLLVKLGRAREAESLLAALPQTERSVAVEYYHGKALKGLNRPKEALRRFQAAAALASPDFPQAGLELARLYEELGERKKARKTREGMLKRKNNPETVLLLALLAAASGDQEHAMALVRKGPATPDFLFSAVRVFMEGRQWKPAESLLKELLKRPETNGNMREVVYANLAKIALVDRGDH